MIMALSVFVFFPAEKIFSQQRIAHIQPDALGPGMTIAMEVMAPAKDTGAFGTDGIYLPSVKILLLNPTDSLRIIFGPVVVSWNGRVLQIPVMAISNVPGPVRFKILTGKKQSSVAVFDLQQPHPKISISGSATLGDTSFALFSFNGLGNTIVADELELLGSGNGVYNFLKEDNDTSISGNPHYHPVTLLSRGPIHLRSAEITVSADTLNGGPGGGGGGHGFSGTGGAGYTGGGSDSAYSTMNVGSGANSTGGFGGASSTGVLGGASSTFNSDQGGGGGTGCPYGSSGTISGGNDSSDFGGYGGASAGGEAPGVPYGGGGGAYGTNGESGKGIGNNGGKINGGRFLLPMQGGSGGGAGNHISDKDSTTGSGGGGGGALTLISFDTLSIVNGVLTANGANGTSGIDSVDAGGGGGSGGGLLLSARNGVTLSNANISASGGSGELGGGKGNGQKSKGGTGSIGRIRIDGDTTTQNSFFSGVRTSGPTLNISAIPLPPPYALFSGSAGDSASLTDSIRIYYRNEHSSWISFDTIRFKSPNNRYRWQAFLPVGHDSTLYVSAMAQVRNPNRTFANFEPERLLSHLSSGIIKVKPTPHLVLLQDTLIFGCYKIGDPCVSANFYLSNWGEDSLHIHSINISNSNFTVTPSAINLGYYNSDSITITYCPKTVGKETAIITFISDDTIRKAVLIGCGVDKDRRITLKPSSLDFGRVHIGKCDTLLVTARSVGKDSVLISPNGFTHSPFEIIKPKKDTILAPKDSLQIFISFCPSDTGDYHTSYIITEKRDSVKVTGFASATRKILSAPKDTTVKSLCINSCDSIVIKLSSIGNEFVRLDSISGVTVRPNVFPITLFPQTDTNFVIYYCASEKGDTAIHIHYFSDADSSNETVLHYHGINPEFRFDSALHFKPLCIPSADSLVFSVHRIGNDTITIDSLRLKNATVFTIAKQTYPKTDSLHTTIFFTPNTSGVYSDTLFVTIHMGKCKDSVLSIPVDGTASNGDVVFSKKSLSFGTVDIGLCKDDSITVSNPCGNLQMLPILPVTPPFYIISPPGNILSIPPSGSSKIIYRFCPATEGKNTFLQVFSVSNKNDSIFLSGIGLPIIDSPFVRFKLAHTTVTAGQEFTYSIDVDSISSGTNIRSLDGRLSYDPTLVLPLSMNGVTWKIFGNSETIPGTYNFSASNPDSLRAGPFATLQMLALYGTHDTTSVFLEDIKVSNYSATTVIPGFIQVVHCGNLPGHIIVAGAYALGNPAPNPAAGLLLLPIVLGNDGILRIRIYNASGMIALERSLSIKRGENTITLDVATLPSGIYYLSADSWGWHEGKTLVIQK